MRLLFALLFVLAPAAARAQSVPVTFRVDLSVQAEAGRFDPAVNFVDVAGSFNGWGADPAVLADDDGDLVYEVTLGGFTPGSVIEYKHRINGAWDGREEFPGGGGNRRYTVRAADNVLFAYYNDEAPTDGPMRADFTSSVAEVAAGGVVAFEDRSAGAVTGRRWSFPGGVPEASTAPEPVVRYDTPGTYDVTLVVEGAASADTLVRAGAVVVRPRPDGRTYWWNDAVFYEVFVRSFMDTDSDGVGDFEGLRRRLDYLNDGDPSTDTDLGVTGLWLMPIHPSPSYHGYDVTDYRGVHPDYGTMDEFRRLVDEAHARGIRVIIDYVMNHSSNEHPWFVRAAQGDSTYGDFYRWRAAPSNALGPWGQRVWHRTRTGDTYYGLFWGGMPDLNYRTDAVRDSLFAAARFWLEDVGVDGFRLDAVKYIFEDDDRLENTDETFAFWADFERTVKDAAPDAFTVCEAWDETAVAARYVREGELDYCFEFGLAGAVLGAVQRGDARGLRDRMEIVRASYPFGQYGTFLTNHDQDRVLDVVGGDEGRARAAAALYLTLPGVPYIYYGEELGQRGTGAHENIRRPMQWSDRLHAGFTGGTPWMPPHPDYRTRNVAAQHADPGSLLGHYRRLIRLRNETPALRRGDYAAVLTSAPEVMSFVRRYEGETVLVAVNTSAAPVRAALTLPATPPGDYLLVDLVGGDTLRARADGAGTFEGLDVAAHGLRAYRVAAGGTGTSDDPTPARASQTVLAPPYPNPATDAATVTFVLAAPGPLRLDLYDVLGRRVRTLVGAVLPAGPHAVRVDVAGLAAGVYHLRLVHGAGEAVRPLVVR